VVCFLQRGAIFGVVVVVSENAENLSRSSKRIRPGRWLTGLGGCRIVVLKINGAVERRPAGEVTGGNAAVSGARGCHFRRRFHRSLYSICKLLGSTNLNNKVEHPESGSSG